MDEIASDNLTKPLVSGYPFGLRDAENALQPVKAPVDRSHTIKVTCEKCGKSYKVARRSHRRPNSRRLCLKCRGSVGGHAAAPSFTPESTPAERIRANGLINERIKSGKIERPRECQHCAKPCRTDGHHPDYSQPELIVFLCRSCHMKAHRDKSFEIEVAAKASNTGAVRRSSPLPPKAVAHA